jgi:hypothetical protein
MMLKSKKTLVSDHKMIWDQYWSQSKMRGLVLCGSIASFMTKNVIRSKAFYGRVNTVIHLQELARHRRQNRFYQDKVSMIAYLR